MKGFDIVKDQGAMPGFEIGNALISRAQIVEFFGALPDTEVVRDSAALHRNQDGVFCEFTVQGRLFHAWEPFGDNSRFWIEPESQEPCPQLAIVRDTFETYTPSYLPFRGLFGRLKSWLRLSDSLCHFLEASALGWWSFPASSPPSRLEGGSAPLPSCLSAGRLYV